MLMYANDIYPEYDPQYISLQKAILESELIVTWAVPLPIIDVMCGFSLGKFVECASVDCTQEIDIFNAWQYKNHSDGLKLNFLMYKNKYYCIQCFRAKKLVICHTFNAKFIIDNNDIVFDYDDDSDKPYGCEDLCNEILPKKFANIKQCASGCGRQYMICSNNCIRLILQKCGVCEGIIGSNCAQSDLESICVHCLSPICAACAYGNLTDVDQTICNNCNSDISDQIMT